MALALAAAAALAGVLVLAAYRRDMAAVAARLAADGRTVETRAGRIEFASGGEGPALIVLHGAGGGHDQGRLIAAVFADCGFRWIAPSRFGYLGTPMPEDASVAAQAEALAALLDHLGVHDAAVLAMSGGVPVALQFAAGHPGRSRALALLSSAPFTPMRAREQGLALPAGLYQLLFRSDFPFWLIAHAAPRLMERLFDVTPAIRARMGDSDRRFLSAMIDLFEPVSARAAGLANEGAAIDPAARYDLAAIAAPTLVVHARDDAINAFAIAQTIAGGIQGADLMALEEGGHLLIGHHAEVRQRVCRHLAR
ncbi:pimeloyl-ACP methyl ester carboxylesterase [Hoeflea marina]|uniref:Pimeloyl-ACP methyl ester carboxylesterase n=2 Tax=Hoeflea marina TaxID=274592 RepID=A0A317PG29_9HYPH|nr:pimeloyl-ACP methyl ester carboxylesterase [Hoeflea marina]